MLLLKPEKEHLLTEKYGFEKETRPDGSYYYSKRSERPHYARSSRMYVDSQRVTIASFSLLNQDLLYDMIMDGTLIKAPNYITEQKKLEEEIEKLKKKIKEMEGKLDENQN